MLAPNRFRKTAAVVVVVVVMLSLPATVGVSSVGASQPQPPHSFYGEATINGEPLAENTTIVAKIDGEVRGQITINETGEYGGAAAFEEKLNVSGSEEDDGKTITFHAKNLSAEETATWTAGSVTELNLTFTDTEDPVADAGPNRTVAVNSSVTFDGSDSTDNFGIDSYAWDFDDGTTASGEVVSHTFEETGEYAVELTVTDEGGNTDTDTVYVDVREGPSISVLEPEAGAQLNESAVGVTYALAGTVLEGASGAEYRIDDGDWQEVEFAETEDEVRFEFETDPLDDGEHTLEMRIVDENGEPIEEFESAQDSVTFVVDTTAPTISLQSPSEGDVAYDTETTLDFDVEDKRLGEVSYRVNTTGDGWKDIESPFEIDVFAEAWVEGPTAVTVAAVDEAGNENTKTFEFRFVSPPSIDSFTPTDGALLNTTTPMIDVAYSDDALGVRETGIDPSAVGLAADGEAVALGDAPDAAGFSYELTSLEIEDADNSTHTVTVTAVDEVGHSSSETHSITIDALAPRTSLNANAAGASLGFTSVGEQNPAEIELSANDTHHAGTVLEVRNADGDVVFQRDVTDATGGGTAVAVEWNATDSAQSPVASGVYEVAIESHDAAGNLGVENTTVTVDNDAPTVSIVDVSGGNLIDGTFYSNDTLSVVVEATDAPSDIGEIDAVDVRLRARNWNYRQLQFADRVEGADDRYNVTFDLTELPDEGEFGILSRAIDLARNTGTDQAPETVVYDDTDPKLSAVVNFNATTEEGTVTVRSTEALQAPPEVSVQLPGDETTSVSMSSDGDTRWSGTFDTNGSGNYRIVANGTDLVGNTGSDVASATIQFVSTDNQTATILNTQTETFIEFRTSTEVSDTFVTVSENEISPEELDEELLGVGFLTSELGDALAGNLTNATIAVPVDEEELPEDVEPEDVNITHYNETLDDWEPVPTTVENVSREIGDETVEGEYWLAEVEEFSTYGAVVQDTDAPIVTSRSPTGELTYGVTETTVRFEYEDNLSDVDPGAVELYLNGKQVTDDESALISSSAASFEATELVPGRTYTATVKVVDTAGNAENYSTQFSTIADTDAPTIDSISPADGASFDASTDEVTIDVSYSDALSGVDTESIQLLVDGEDVTSEATFDSSSLSYPVSGLEPDTTHQFTVRVADEVGNQQERTVSFGIQAEADDSDDTGGGGGGGGGGSAGGTGLKVDSRSQPFGHVVEIKSIGDDTVTVSIGMEGAGVEVAELEITPFFDPPEVTVYLYTPTAEPSESPALTAGEPIAYFQMALRDALPKNIKEVGVTFTVEESQLPGDARPEQVTLYRYSDGEWHALETAHLGGATYRAMTPGFSEFAIGIAPMDAGETTTTTTTTPEPTTTTTTPEPTTTTTATTTTTTTTETFLPGFGPLIAIVALVVAGALGRRRLQR